MTHVDPPLKSLLILRHADALPRAGSQADFDRVLSPLGREQAARVGRFLKEARIPVDAVLCSAAPRAAETAQLALQAAGLSVPLHLERACYEVPGEELLRLLHDWDGPAQHLLVVGHNPGVAHLLGLLTTHDGQLSVAFPPATLAAVSVAATSWHHLEPTVGTLRWLLPAALLG
jgi:phosphohistidine phosphatase